MIFVVALAAPLLGLALIFLIARFSPDVPRNPHPLGDDTPEVTPDEFCDAITDLVRALGLRIVFSSAGTGAVLDITARDPRPLAGGRLLVHATPVLAHGQVEASEVLHLAESVRSDAGTLKGIYIALAGFTEEAIMAARTSPAALELIDAATLLALLDEHLPGRGDELRKYRGFAHAEATPRRHRAPAPSDDAER